MPNHRTLTTYACAQCGTPFHRHHPSQRFCSNRCSALGRYGTPTERFLRQAKQLPDGCWRWLGRSVTRQGYGRFSLEGRFLLAHRAAWLLFVGPIPDGLLVRHRCPEGGRSWCVNPSHLQVGTATDNMQDMLNDKRHWAQTGLILHLPEELRARLKTRALTEGISLQALIVRLLELTTHGHDSVTGA